MYLGFFLITSLTTNNASALTTTNTSGTNSPAANNSRLNQFNRLATERKTVHVMGLGKEAPFKRDKQMMNQSGAAGFSGNSNTLSHQSYVPGQSTLDYTMNTRSNTNAGSFLQKLSSKFTRRYDPHLFLFCSQFKHLNLFYFIFYFFC